MTENQAKDLVLKDLRSRMVFNEDQWIEIERSINILSIALHEIITEANKKYLKMLPAVLYKEGNHAKKVLLINKEGEIIDRLPSLTKAAEKAGITKQGMWNAINRHTFNPKLNCYFVLALPKNKIKNGNDQ